MMPDKPEGEHPKPKRASAKQPDVNRTMKIKLPAEKSGKPLLDPKWLQSRSNEELIDLMCVIALELKARPARSTEQVAASAKSPSFPDIQDGEVKEFVRLPVASKKPSEEIAATTWKIILVSSKRDHKPLGLEICGDVIVGRGADNLKPDLDLTQHDAEQLGVSRQHAMLRPTKKELLLVDLGSTNGTYCNAEKVHLGSPRRLKTGDAISLGDLHFQFRVVSQPV